MADNKALSKEFLGERDLKIMKLRQAGVSYSEIAKRFNMTTRGVATRIRKVLEDMNSEALMAYPELLRMELERLDALQAAIWPMTQHRKVTADDGQEIQLEPDVKAIQQVLGIMDRRFRLLGMERTNINIQMESNQNVNVRATLAGAEQLDTSRMHTAEAEARQLLELMGRSGALPQETIRAVLGESDVIDAEVVEDGSTDVREQAVPLSIGQEAQETGEE
jgi:DNA-binding Lrp family transcriptional regulator